MSELKLNNQFGTEIGKEFAEALQALMAISETDLEQNLDLYKEQLGGYYNESITRNIKNELLRGLDMNESTREDAVKAISSVKNAILDYIDNLQPSNKRQELIDCAFKPIFECFDEVLERYHLYDFELPIKLDEDAIMPTYAHDSDAAADLYALETVTLPAHSISNLIHTGVHIQLPEGWCAKVWPRSSMGLKTGLRLSNSAGIIDTEYRGDVGVIYDNISDSEYTINKGDRIAQMTIEPVYRFKPKKVDILSASDRGEGGFGSTGK